MSFCSASIYAASLHRVNTNTADDRDRMIVEQWALNRALTEELMQNRISLHSSMLQASNAGSHLTH